MTVAAILLAAGAGSRFDGDTHKLLANLRGHPVIAHSLRSVLFAGFNEVIVVTGAAQVDEVITTVADEAGQAVRIVHNPHWATGQASSLQAGIDALAGSEHTGAVVGLADQPDVGIAAWRTVGATHGSIVAASFDGKRRPPVKLDRSVWHLLPTSGDEGARDLMKSHPDLVAEVRCAGNPGDIDTAADLESAGDLD